MIDRLSIDKSVNENLIPKIDQTKFLGLDNSNAGRIELFMFALALGVKKGYRTPLAAKHGFILESAIGSDYLSMIDSLHVNEVRKTNEDELIGDKESAFSIAQEYANTGFQEISAWITEHGNDDEGTAWQLIAEMNEEFEHLTNIF